MTSQCQYSVSSLVLSLLCFSHFSLSHSSLLCELQSEVSAELIRLPALPGRQAAVSGQDWFEFSPSSVYSTLLCLVCCRNVLYNSSKLSLTSRDTELELNKCLFENLLEAEVASSGISCGYRLCFLCL